MKERFFFKTAFLTLVAALFLTGCQSHTEVPSIESIEVQSTQETANESAKIKLSLIDAGNGASLPISKAVDVSDWYLFVTEPGASPQEKTIVFNGTEITGKFFNRVGMEGCATLKDFYLIDDRNQGITFTVNYGSGELVGISPYYELNAETKDSLLPLSEDPLKNAEKEARKWAEELLTNPDSYTMIPLEYVDYYYPFRFVRTVNGIETTDGVTIGISDRGGLTAYLMMDVGWVSKQEEELKSLSTFDAENQIREELKEYNTSLRSINNSKYGRTPNGEVVLIVDCTVRTSAGVETAAKFLISIE